jgi:hypothetical protein
MSSFMRAERSVARRLPAGILLAALLGTLALVTFGATGALASKTMWSVFEDHPYLVQTDTQTRARTLDEIQELGADTIRVEIKWNEVAPQASAKTRPAFDATNPSDYPGFGAYDDLIRSVSAKKLRIILTITGDAPRWATSEGRGGNFKPNPSEYAKFVSAVAKRYSGIYSGLPKIIYFSIWNEPNHIQFIKPTSQAPRIYRGLVDAAIPALRANAAPAAKVFVGELKPTPRKGVGPLKFLQQWLCLDSRFRKLRGRAARKQGCTHFKKIDADGFAHHPYGPVVLVPKRKDIINLLAIKRLASVLDLAAKAGRLPAHLPIYNTEFGIQTNPPDIFVSTTPQAQARIINEKEEFAYRYSRLKSHSQYQLYDDPGRPGPPAVKWSGFQTGLRFANGTKKPAWQAYKLPIVVRKSKANRRSVVIWGRIRPVFKARFVQLQRRAGARFVDVGARFKTNALGYFTVVKPRGAYRFLGFGSEDGSTSASSISDLGASRTAASG